MLKFFLFVFVVDIFLISWLFPSRMTAYLILLNCEQVKIFFQKFFLSNYSLNLLLLH